MSERPTPEIPEPTPDVPTWKQAYRRAAMSLSAHCEDYLIVVRPKNDPTVEWAYNFSDETWARGSAGRVHDDLRDRQSHETFRQMGETDG